MTAPTLAPGQVAALAHAAARGEERTGRPLWLTAAWVSLALSVLPLGFAAGLPFRLALADVFIPLMIPVVLVVRPLPRLAGLVAGLVIWSLIVVLGWALLEADSPAAPLGSLAFFWKSWFALLLAYVVIMRSPDRRKAVRRVLDFVVVGQVVLIAMAYAGWVVTGRLVTGGSTDLGADVTGFTAGTWPYPVQLYGYGQVNVTAAMLALGGPILAYKAAACSSILTRAFWVAWIPAGWWLILNSGSRGALITAGLFVAFLPLATSPAVGRISVVKLLVSVGLTLGVLTNAQLVLQASPKYARTLNEVRSGDTSGVASGRDEINALSLADIKRSPFFGTGYGDYQRFHTSADTRWSNSSPHNTFLGPFLKGGIPVGLGYLVLLGMGLPWRRPRTFPGMELLALPLVIPMLIGIFLVGDALTTPALAANILTLSGALLAARSIETDEAQESSEESPAASDGKARS